MKYSFEWLQDFIDLGEFRSQPQKLADLLTSAGLEVEEVMDLGKPFENVVTGLIVNLEKHPNSDRLTLCQVMTKEGVTHQIVCGAKNHKKDDKVAVALPGAVLPGNLRIQLSTIRGVESHGMLCSEAELGLSSNGEAQSIFILPDDAPLGIPFAEYYGISDLIFDLKITANRADCLSHFGLARELSSLLSRPLKDRLTQLHEASIASLVENQLVVRIEDLEFCPFYFGLKFSGARVAPSPDWLQRRLKNIGVKPINNLVDVTNFVMMELGQPLHVFDSERVEGGVLQVRRARTGEKFITLDGTELTLSSEDWVIADASQALALAGVVGGHNSGIQESTTEVILECAYFWPAKVRRTSRRHGISTDSSDRFSKGVNPAQSELALHRATSLIIELSGAKPLGLVRMGQVPRATRSLEFPSSVVSQRLGYPINETSVIHALEKVFCRVQKVEGQAGVLKVELPPHRMDLRIKEDLIEEVGRLEGYDRIPYSLPLFGGSPLPHSREFSIASKCARILAKQGALEVSSLALTDPEAEERFWFSSGRVSENSCLATHISLRNPLSRELGALRRSLSFGLYKNLCYNVHQSQEEGFTFEVGKVFERQNNQIRESLNLGICLWGEVKDPWDGLSREPIVIRLKEQILALGEALGVDLRVKGHFESAIPSFFHPYQSSEIFWGAKKVGILGALHPALLEEDKIRFPAALGELFLQELIFLPFKASVIVQERSHLPVVRRELSLVMEAEVSSAWVTNELKEYCQSSSSEGLRVSDVVLVNWYEGDSLPSGKKSLSYRFELQAMKKTPSEAEIQVTMDRILGFCRDRFRAELR